MPKNKCKCPIYCIFCGARLKKDNVGHYCPTDNCQWQYGVDDCVKEEVKQRVKKLCKKLSKDDKALTEIARKYLKKRNK